MVIELCESNLTPIQKLLLTQLCVEMSTMSYSEAYPSDASKETPDATNPWYFTRSALENFLINIHEDLRGEKPHITRFSLGARIAQYSKAGNKECWRLYANILVANPDQSTDFYWFCEEEPISYSN